MFILIVIVTGATVYMLTRNLALSSFQLPFLYNVTAPAPAPASEFVHDEPYEPPSDTWPFPETLVFASRAQVQDDASRNCSFVLPPSRWPWVLLYGEGQDTYIEKLLQRTEDWVVSIDTDAFIVDYKEIFRTMRMMEALDQDFTCWPDCGQEPRYHFNGISCNPWFNIFRLKAIRHKLGAYNTTWRMDNSGLELFRSKFGHFNPWHFAARPPHRIDPSCFPHEMCNHLHAGQMHPREPVDALMIYMRYHLNVAYSCTRAFVVKPNTPLEALERDVPEQGTAPGWIGTTLLSSVSRRPYAFHAWYARRGPTARLRFLSTLAKLYGDQPVNDTCAAWLPVRHADGLAMQVYKHNPLQRVGTWEMEL